MRPRCAVTSRLEWWLVMGVWASACGPTDGDIGTRVDASALPRAPTFEEPFADPGLAWPTRAVAPGASVAIGSEAGDAIDGRVARLVFPGHPAYAAADRAGPPYRTELASVQRFGFGTHRSRVSFGGCGETQEVVQAVLGYFADGEDHNDNGLVDEIEIDFQVLCGAMNFAYLTVFTDYEVSNSGIETFRKLSRIVDLTSGRLYDTPFDDRDSFASSGTDGSLAIPNVFRAETFYEVGFEWHQGSIRFFLDLGHDERTLWTLEDARYVPTVPVQIMYNLWHPDSHWFPQETSADYPEEDVVMLVDWFRFEAEQ